jgi:hypothetical protein
MNYIYGIMINLLMFPNFLPDGAPTLTKEDYIALKDDINVFQSKAQLLYADSIGGGKYLYARTLQLYGNGGLLISIMDMRGHEEKWEFYSKNGIEGFP